MSEQRSLLCDTADRLFAAVGPEPAGWTPLAEAGFPLLLVPETGGGFGGDWGDFVAVARLAGRHAVPQPLGEAMIGHWVAAAAGGGVDGIVTLAPRATGALAGDRFSGICHHVPWGRDSTIVVARIGEQVFLVDRSSAKVDEGHCPAGEPRDTLTFDAAPVLPGLVAHDLDTLGALLRTAQIAGALDRALELSIDHVNQREQFGKPLAKFQAVQQALATLAIEAGAVNAAAEAAALALDGRTTGDGALFEIAAAKLRGNMAAATGIAIAHQVHGAIGFTQDYPLHRFTRRLMGWRTEYGNERHWSDRLGGIATALGGAGLWAEMTRRSDGK